MNTRAYSVALTSVLLLVGLGIGGFVGRWLGDALAYRLSLYIYCSWIYPGSDLCGLGVDVVARSTGMGAGAALGAVGAVWTWRKLSGQ